MRRDSYCFKPGYKHQSAAILPLEALPKDIADLFTRAFIIGKTDPKQRPDAAEWHRVLIHYEESLVTCKDNPLHQYDRKNSKCPFCEADRQFGIVICGNASVGSLKQSTYSAASPPEAAQPIQTPLPSTTYNYTYSPIIQSPISSSAQMLTIKTPRLNRKFLKITSIMCVLASFAYILLILYGVLVSLPWISNNQIPQLLVNVFYGAYMLFMGITGLKHYQNASKTTLLRIISLISLALVLVPPFTPINIVGLYLSVLFLVSVVDDETYLTQTPGYLLLKSAGILNIILAAYHIISAFMTNVFFTHILVTKGYLWVYAIVELSFWCYQTVLGIIGIRFSKTLDKARLLRNFSLFGIALVFSLYFAEYSLVKRFSDYGINVFYGFEHAILFFTLYLVPCTLLLLGASNNHYVAKQTVKTRR